MTYYVNYLANRNSSVLAMTYNPTLKTLVSVNSRVGFENGADYFALVVNGDYPMVVDSDGLLVGDLLERGASESFPRLDIMAMTCGIRQRLASITQQGALLVGNVTESASLPSESMNLLDQVAFSHAGLTTTKVNEVWFMADQDSNYVITDGQFIRVRI